VHGFSCTGWWEQRIYGRKPMEPLQVAISRSSVAGSGADIVGRFTLDGEIAPGGEVSIRKTYLGKHVVHYEGQYDGEGRMWGQWTCGPDSGRWMISVGRDCGGTDLPPDIADIRPYGR
jgi:hypothetical protein